MVNSPVALWLRLLPAMHAKHREMRADQVIQVTGKTRPSSASAQKYRTRRQMCGGETGGYNGRTVLISPVSFARCGVTCAPPHARGRRTCRHLLVLGFRDGLGTHRQSYYTKRTEKKRKKKGAVLNSLCFLSKLSRHASRTLPAQQCGADRFGLRVIKAMRRENTTAGLGIRRY